MKTFLVLGSNSFSGSHFVDYLLDQGYPVIGISRSSEINPVYLPYKDNKNVKNFSFYQYDLNHHLADILDVIVKEKPSYIVNFLAQGMVAQSWDTPEDWYQTNLLGQVKFHNELRKLTFIEKYVHITTPEVYGSTAGWIKENFSFAPSTPYAVSRAACDLHLKSFFDAYNFPVVFTRAANVYGPGQQLYRIAPRAILFARTGRKLKLHGGGQSVRSFIYIRDVAAATLKIALNGQVGQSYHISTNELVTIEQLVRNIAALCNVKFDELVQMDHDRLGKDQAYKLDSSKLRDELTWSDAIGLEQGLRSTVEWIDKNLALLRTLPDEYVHKK